MCKCRRLYLVCFVEDHSDLIVLSFKSFDGLRELVGDVQFVSVEKEDNSVDPLPEPSQHLCKVITWKQRAWTIRNRLLLISKVRFFIPPCSISPRVDTEFAEEISANTCVWTVRDSTQLYRLCEVSPDLINQNPKVNRGTDTKAGRQNAKDQMKESGRCKISVFFFLKDSWASDWAWRSLFFCDQESRILWT